MSSRARQNRGFTLLEVMLAVAIMAIALGAVFSAEAGSAKMAQRARKLSFATLLSRCKMGEIEEDLGKKGLPSVLMTETDECCKDAPIDGFRCKWEVVPVVLPDAMFNKEDDKKKPGQANASGPGAAGPGAAPGGISSSSKGGVSGLFGAVTAALGGKNPDGTPATPDPSKDPSKDPNKDPKKQDPKDVLPKDPTNLLAGGNNETSGGEVDGLAAMAMQYVYPILKPAFQSQIRRISVTVDWSEGSADKKFELTQYFVAEQPVPLATDPNNPNAALTGTGTGTGTGTTTGTPANTGLANPLGGGLIR